MLGERSDGHSENERVLSRKLAMINTEIHGHRPPWIQLFQMSSRLPLAAMAFRELLGSPTFLRSPVGFGGAFDDLGLIDGDFRETFIAPLLADPRRLEGQLR